MTNADHQARTWRLKRLGVAALALAWTGLPSCNIVAPAAYILGGQEKADAVYKLADRPTVVFVDDRRNVINGRVALRAMISETATQSLMVNKVVTKTISPRDTMSLARQRDTAKEPLAMDELGRTVGADQVIYIEMVDFTLSPDGVTPRPTASCRVRVIDAVNRTRLFPPTDATEPSYLLQVALHETGPEAYQSQATRRQLEDKLALELGDRLAKLFFKHVPDEIGSHL